MNAYNIFNEGNYSTILYHAIAKSEEQVKELAQEANINLESLTIELERSNIKAEFGNLTASISDAIVK